VIGYVGWCSRSTSLSSLGSNFDFVGVSDNIINSNPKLNVVTPLHADHPNHINNFFSTRNDILWSFNIPPENSSNYRVKLEASGSSKDNYEALDFASMWAEHDVIELTTNAYAWHTLLNNSFCADHINTFFPYLRSMDHYQLAHTVMRITFSGVSHTLISYADQYLGQYRDVINSTLFIGVQHRSGDNAFGQKIHRFRHKEVEPFANIAADQCKLALDNSSHLYHNKIARNISRCVFFITSDNIGSIDRFEQGVASRLQSMRHHFNVVYTKGQPVHLGLLPQSSNEHSVVNETFEFKTYLDWYILSEMDVLIVSRSGYGETAVWRHMPKAYVFNFAGFEPYPANSINYVI